MNLKKILAGTAAASLAATTLAVGAFAATEKSVKPNSPGELYDMADFPGNYFLDIYLTDETNILDDITALNGAVALGVGFKVSEFDNYGEEFYVYAAYETLDDSFESEDVTVTEDGDYTAWIELDNPLEVDEDYCNLYLGTFFDDEFGNGGVPKFEVTEILVQLADDGAADDGTTDDGTNDDGTTDDGTNDDGTNDDGAADDGAGADNGTGDTSDKTDDDKGNADTGIEGVAVAAGIAAVAAGVVVVAKKRK